MADLIELDLVVKDKGLKASVSTVERLERQIIKAQKAVDQNTISQARYNKILLAAKRDYQALGVSSQRATAQVRAFAAANKTAQVTTAAQTTTLNSATVATNKLSAAQAQTKNKMNGNNMAIQQLGYQMGDFAVQVQGGTSAFVAFSQQGAQLAGILPMIAGPLGLSMKAAVGLSAALGILIPIGSAVGRMFFEMRDSAKEAAKEAETLDGKLKSLSSTLEDYADTLAAIAAGTSLDELFATRGVSSATEDLNKARVALEKLNKEYEISGGLSTSTGNKYQFYMDSLKNLFGAGVADKYKVALEAVIVAETRLAELRNKESAERFKNFSESRSSLLDELELLRAIEQHGEGSEKANQAELDQELRLRLASVDAQVKSGELTVAQGVALKKQVNAAAALGVQIKANAQEQERLDSAAANTAKFYADAYRSLGESKVAGQELAETRLEDQAANTAKFYADAYTQINKSKIAGQGLADAAYEAWQNGKNLSELDLGEGVNAAALAAGELSKELNISLQAAMDMIALSQLVNPAAGRGRGAASGPTAADMAGTFVGQLAAQDAAGRLAEQKALNKAKSAGASASEEAAAALKKEIEALELSADATAKYAHEYDKLLKLKDAGLSEQAFAKAVAKLNEELANSSPVLQGFTDAFTNFLSTGANDFKTFANDIIGMFKNMLIKMIAMAAKNKIMLSMGMGGSALATSAAAGNLAGVGSAAGTGAMGSFVGGFGAAGGAAGTGLLGGMGSVASGAMSGGLAGGAGAVGTALSGATTGMAGFGAAVGAVALPLLAVAAVFSFFKKKTKELDSGLNVTVKNMDTFVESFSKVQTSKFWGLSKTTSTTTGAASDAVANPIIAAVSEIQDQVVKAADALGVASDAFEGFSYDFKLSLKGLTEEQAMGKINEELLKMGDSFASFTGHFSTMNELLQAANTRMELRNRLDNLLGNNQEVLIRQREAELSAMHELNRPLAEAIYNLEDAKNAVSDAFTNLRLSVNLLVKGLQDKLTVANEAVNRSRGIFNQLKSALSGRSLTSGVSQASSRRDGAMSFIRGGDFSDEDKLSDALRVVSEPTEGLFGSFEDYARDFAKTSSAILDAKNIAEVQLTADEQQVLLLEQQIEDSEKQYQIQVDQYNALLGINVSVNSVSQAVATLKTAISSMVLAQNAATAAATASAPSSSGGGSTAPTQKTITVVSSFGGGLGGASGVVLSDGRTFKTGRGWGNAAEIRNAKNDARAAILKEGNIPAFANGGMHKGGMRLVGERGPEIESTGPSRIFSNKDTSSMFKNPELVEEIRGLRSEVAGLRSEQRQMQATSSKFVKRNYEINRKWDVDGLPATRA